MLGVIGSWIVARALAPFHYRVGAADPVTWAAVLVILGITAVAAAALPARRAARTDRRPFFVMNMNRPFGGV